MTTFVEFPYYDDTLTIPEGWVDVSWHNNACPSISKRVNPVFSVVVWCDFKDPKRREVGDSASRFIVSTEDDVDGYETKGCFFNFDDAILFANSLHSSLTKGE